MSTLHLDAEALYGELLAAMRALVQPGSALVGIWRGGAWLAERLHRDLQLAGEHGVITSALHRDDFSSRGDLDAASAAIILDQFLRERSMPEPLAP